MPDFSQWCKYCGVFLHTPDTPDTCQTSPTRRHAFTTAAAETAAADIPDTPQHPLDRLIHLVAESSLIRELPQTDDVPLLRRAEVVAQLYQAQALKEIAGSLAVIREALTGLPDWIVATGKAMEGLDSAIVDDEFGAQLRVDNER